MKAKNRAHVSLTFHTKYPVSWLLNCFPTIMAGTLSADRQKQLVTRYQRLREEVDQLYSTLAEVDSERNEHE